MPRTLKKALTKEGEKASYVTIRLPKSLVEKVDKYILESGEYSSRADFVKEAIRLRLQQLGISYGSPASKKSKKSAS